MQARNARALPDAPRKPHHAYRLLNRAAARPGNAADGQRDLRLAVVQGTVSIANGWTVEVQTPFRRRLEDGSHVLWRPGLTLWLHPEEVSATSLEDRLNELRGEISVEASEVRSVHRGEWAWLTYRLQEVAQDGRAAALYAFVVGRLGHLRVAAYFDREDDLRPALAAIESARRVYP